MAADAELSAIAAQTSTTERHPSPVVSSSASPVAADKSPSPLPLLPHHPHHHQQQQQHVPTLVSMAPAEAQNGNSNSSSAANSHLPPMFDFALIQSAVEKRLVSLSYDFSRFLDGIDRGVINPTTLRAKESIKHSMRVVHAYCSEINRVLRAAETNPDHYASMMTADEYDEYVAYVQEMDAMMKHYEVVLAQKPKENQGAIGKNSKRAGSAGGNNKPPIVSLKDSLYGPAPVPSAVSSNNSSISSSSNNTSLPPPVPLERNKSQPDCNSMPSSHQQPLLSHSSSTSALLLNKKERKSEAAKARSAQHHSVVTSSISSQGSGMTGSNSPLLTSVGNRAPSPVAFTSAAAVAAAAVVGAATTAAAGASSSLRRSKSHNTLSQLNNQQQQQGGSSHSSSTSSHSNSVATNNFSTATTPSSTPGSTLTTPNTSLSYTRRKVLQQALAKQRAADEAQRVQLERAKQDLRAAHVNNLSRSIENCFVGVRRVVVTCFDSVKKVVKCCCPPASGSGHHSQSSWQQIQAQSEFIQNVEDMQEVPPLVQSNSMHYVDTNLNSI